MEFSIYFWIGFFIFIILSLFLDLGIINKKAAALSFKKAVVITTFWVMLALLFCLTIYFFSTKQKALEFLTGYIIELSLSIDNVFVFILIFSYFKVPQIYQHRVLFWGIIGAIVLRFIMIIGGIYIFQKVSWIFYIFGAVLIYSGIKIATAKESEQASAPNYGSLKKFFGRYFKISEKYYGEKFFATDDSGNKVATPLFLVLLLIEKTDLIFALDSVPAVISITQDYFIVFTSNIFAILGLRSLYFMLSNLVDRFKYLKFGISVILVFVGIKMIAGPLGLHLSVEYSLAIIFGILISSIAFSMLATSGKKL